MELLKTETTRVVLRDAWSAVRDFIFTAPGSA